MDCIRCGNCCISSWASIIDKPAEGIVKGNVIAKEGGKRCQHLTGPIDGKYSCNVRGEAWFPKSPCHAPCSNPHRGEPPIVGNDNSSDIRESMKSIIKQQISELTKEGRPDGKKTTKPRPAKKKVKVYEGLRDALTEGIADLKAGRQLTSRVVKHVKPRTPKRK